MEHLKLYIFPTPSFFTKTVRVTEIGLFSINSKIGVIGLDYVGFLLAVEKAKGGLQCPGLRHPETEGGQGQRWRKRR